MTTRDVWASAEVLSRYAAELTSGGFGAEGGAEGFEPVQGKPLFASSLPERVPGASHDAEPGEAAHEPRGPRSIILDCGESRMAGYTHVLWIAPSAESVLGSDGFHRLGEIVGRVFGVTSYEWEGIDQLHVAAGDLPWASLLHEAREALAVYMAGRV